MSRSSIAVGALAVLLSWAEAVASRKQSVPDFLRTHFRMTTADLGDVDRRGVVTRSLDTADSREVATVGVIQLRVPAAFYVAQLRDIAAFKRSEAVLQIGAFEQPARLDDLADLTLEQSDVARLRQCRPSACKVRLSREAIERFRAEVPWHTRAAGDMANQIMRDVLFGLVNDYRRSGDAALMTYAGSGRPLSSSLGLTVLLESGRQGSPGSYLVYVNRSRIDALAGFWGGLKRALVRSRARSGMSDSLVLARDRVERRYRAGAAMQRSAWANSN